MKALSATVVSKWTWARKHVFGGEGKGREVGVRIRAGRCFESKKDWWELVLDSWQRKGGWLVLVCFFFFYEM